MNIRQVIENLSRVKDQEQEIIVAYWLQEDTDYSDEEWDKIIAKEDKTDWSWASETMDDIAKEV